MPIGAEVSVSIHAPVRGATVRMAVIGAYCGNVSIHAPMRGATVRFLGRHIRTSGFNPRTHERCDCLAGLHKRL